MLVRVLGHGPRGARGGASRKRHSTGIREMSLLSRVGAGGSAFSAGPRRTTRAPTNRGRLNGRRARPCVRRQNVALVLDDETTRWQRTLATDDETGVSCCARSRVVARLGVSRVALDPARATGREGPRRRAAREAIPLVSSRASSELPSLRRDGGPARTLAGARPLPLDSVAFLASDDAHPSLPHPPRLPLPSFPRPHAGGAP